MKWLSIFLSTVFPKRDDFERVRALTVDDLSRQHSPVLIKERFVLSSFKDPNVRACIHEVKFQDNEKAAELLSKLLRDWLTTRDTPYFIIPIPLSDKRRQERGYNQVTRVVERAIKSLPGITYSERVLIRQRDTIPQTNLDKKDRAENLKGAFAIHKNASAHSFADKHLLLIDDVLTTGATLSEAEKVLKELQPASLTTVALAH